MTENEVLEYLKSSKRKNDMLGILPGSGIGDTIIKALEELQQYRAIGTPEELITAMKYVRLAKAHKTVGRAIEECAKYEEIGTLEECRAAVEKQKAKKPMHVTDSYSGYQKHKEHVGYCPDCGHQVEEPYGCPNCLRKIDWSDEE